MFTEIQRSRCGEVGLCIGVQLRSKPLRCESGPVAQDVEYPANHVRNSLTTGRGTQKPVPECMPVRVEWIAADPPRGSTRTRSASSCSVTNTDCANQDL